MSDPTSLDAAKASLRRLLQGGSLETAVDAWVRLVASTVRLITMGRVRLGLVTAGIALFVITAMSGIAAAVFSAFRSEHPLTSLGDLLSAHWIGFYVWGSSVAVAQAFVAIFYSRRIRTTIAGSVVEAMDEVADISDLRRWVLTLFDKRRQVRRSLGLAGVISAASLLFLYYRDSEFLKPYTVLFIINCWIQGSFGLYFLVPSLGLATRLSSYRFQLFEFDAARSPIIEDVATMVQETLLVSVMIATFFSTGLFYFGFESAGNKRPLLLLAPWLPILAIFAYYQYALASIILQSQRRSLRQIRRLIEADRLRVLAGESDSGLQALLKVYDKMRSSSSLAIDPKGVISFVTTLLVPLVTFILSWWR